jgi:hypothetical protein
MRRHFFRWIAGATLPIIGTFSAGGSFAQTSKSLPRVFTSVLPNLKASSRIPILLPGELPQPIARAKDALVGETGQNEYAISLYYKLGIGDAGFAASFGAQGKPKYKPQELPDVRAVKLAHGLRGFFRPVSCGGSCAPANLWWEEADVLYQVQLKLSFDDENQEKIITAVADSAILAGPR